MSSLFSPFLDCPFFGVPSILFLAGDGLAFLPSDPNFSKFIALLSSVRHMGTDPKSLRYLSQVPTESGVTFFPSLQSLHLVAIYPESVAQVTDFLLWLKSAGGSIQSLYVDSGSDLADRRVNLSSLEQFSGLEVRWGSPDLPSPTYICGSGTPERLNFVGSFPIRFLDERRSYTAPLKQIRSWLGIDTSLPPGTPGSSLRVSRFFGHKSKENQPIQQKFIL